MTTILKTSTLPIIPSNDSDIPLNQPKCIRLFDTAGVQVIDSVSTDYEDSFCLETFGDLILQHNDQFELPPINAKNISPSADVEKSGNSDKAQRKTFILARVQTWDHKQPGKAYYSYYNAFHLNKILFQTQVYMSKKLIHRLHVLNPLTNTDIIGNVLYFKIRLREDGLDGLSSPPSLPNTSGLNKPDIPTVNTTSIFQRHLSSIPKSVMGANRKSNANRAMKPNSPALHINTSITHLHSKSPRSAPALGGIHPLVPQTWTMAVPFVTIVQDGPDVSKRRTIHQPKQTQISMKLPVVQEAETEPIPKTPIPSTPIASTPIPSTPLNFTPSHQKRRLSTISEIQIKNKITVQVTNQLANEPITINNHKSPLTKMEIPPGTVTQFGVPVSSDVAPSTPPRCRRLLSFSNTKPVQVVEEESTTTWQIGDSAYDMVLFGTDSDYLEQSKIRSFFRQNALTVEDGVLFEMPPVTSESAELDPLQQQIIRFDEHEPVFLLCDECYPSRYELDRMSPVLRCFHSSKMYFLVFLIAGGVVIITLISLDKYRTEATR